MGSLGIAPGVNGHKAVNGLKVANGVEITSVEVTHLETFLADNPSIKYLRYLIVDFVGVIRAQTVTRTFAIAHAREGTGLAVQSPMTSCLTIDGGALFDLVQPGRDILRPDWPSLRVCQFEPSYAQVMCFVEEEPVQAVKKRYIRCPRTRLYEAVALARDKYGIEFLSGFEIEFCIVELEDGIPARPVKTPHVVYASANLYNKYFKLVEQIVQHLEDSGILVQRFHTEGDSGMFEISTGPLAPVEAVDALIYAHETIKTVCAKNGLGATMYPMPFENLETLGEHLHLSLSKPELGTNFLAGLLSATPAISAFTMPTYDSYLRLHKCGLGWISWGVLNRTATYRQIREAYWEMRQFDGCANKYLAFSAVIFAGLLGVEKREPLMTKPKSDFALEISTETSVQLGLQPHPKSLKEALDALSKSELRDSFGSEVIDRYILLKTNEIEICSKLTDIERKKMGMSIF